METALTSIRFVHCRIRFDMPHRSVTPASPITPLSVAEFIGDRNGSADFVARNIRNTSPFNVLAKPSISIPCGFTASGRPIGLQFSGSSGSDAAVLRLAHAYEQATEWRTRL